MLASTVQFSSYGRSHPLPRPTDTTGRRFTQETRWPVQSDPTHAGGSLRTQQCAWQTPSPVPVMFHHPPEGRQVLTRTVMDELFVNVPPLSNHPPTRSASAMASAQPAPQGRRLRVMLLRKEVIQPHLPVRLPCYDLVPIASPTFDSSLHKGWATGFGCYRLS